MVSKILIDINQHVLFYFIFLPKEIAILLKVYEDLPLVFVFQRFRFY